MSYYPPTDWELRDFYREHVDALYRSCSFLTCGEADAQTMVQEIFLKLLNKGMIFSSDKDAKAWMILNAYKMSRKPPKPLQGSVQALGIPEGPDAAGCFGSGETVTGMEETPAQPEASEQKETVALEEGKIQEETSPTEELTVQEEAASQEKEAVQEAPSQEEKPAVFTAAAFPAELRKLSRKARLIALLYYCEGYRKKEIADLLGIPTFAVGSRLKRIKKRILQETGGDEAC